MMRNSGARLTRIGDSKKRRESMKNEKSSRKGKVREKDVGTAEDAEEEGREGKESDWKTER